MVMIRQMPKKGEIKQLPEAKYPEITKLLETEKFDKVNKDFSTTYDELEKLSKSKGGMKKASEARKAMKAIEKTMDILRELLRRKYEIEENAGEATPQGKK
jgi:DNA-binding ferritin-like protein